MKNKFYSLLWLLVVIGCAWQAARAAGVPAFLLPAPQAVLVALVQHRSLLAHHLFFTLTEILLALLVGIGSGTLAAIAMASSQRLRRLLFPLITASQAIPIFALAPLLVLWLGYGIASKIAVAALILFFPLCLSLFEGLCRTPPGWLELAQTLSPSRFYRFRHLYWPAALPGFFTGLHMAMILAPIGVVMGEWVGASEGLGYLMMQSNARLETALSFAALTLLLIITLSLSAVVTLLRRNCLWLS